MKNLFLLILSFSFTLVTTAYASQTLNELVAEGNVVIAGQGLLLFGDEIDCLLGESLRFTGDEDERRDRFGTAIPTNQINVTVYCLNGERQANVIDSAEFDMGGDSGVRFVEINTKNKLPTPICIFVRGEISKNEKSGTYKKIISTDVCRKNEFYDEISYYCKFEDGDFNDDKRIEIVVHEGDNDFSRWNLFDINPSGKVNFIGKIGTSN